MLRPGIALLLAALVLFGSAFASAEPEDPGYKTVTRDGAIYEVDQWIASLVGFEKGRTSAVIYPEIDGKEVYLRLYSEDYEGYEESARYAETYSDITELTFAEGLVQLNGDGLYQLRNLERVHLPASLRTIGGGSFFGCARIRQIDIPDGVEEIQSNAFGDCAGLTRIRLPKGLKTIGSYAFANSPNIAAYDVSPENADFVSVDGAVYSKDKTELVLVPQTVEGTFVVPEGVELLGDFCMLDCKLIRRVEFPASLRAIGEGVFYGCNAVESFGVPDNSAFFRVRDGLLLSRDGTELLAVPGATAGRLDIPNGVESVAESAVIRNETITEISLPEGMPALQYFVPARCGALERLWLPASVEEIETVWQYGLERFRAVEIAEGNPVYFSEDGVVFKKSNNELYLFPYGYGLSYSVPPFVTNIPSYVFDGNEMLQTITIPNGVKTIEEAAFMDCTSLVRVSLPLSLTSIGADAFSDCISLSQIVLPPKLVKLGRTAFYNCASLTRINVPGSVEKIERYTFSGSAEGFTITSPKSSAAYWYAWMNGILWQETRDNTAAVPEPVAPRPPAAMITLKSAENALALLEKPQGNAKTLGMYPNGTTVLILAEEGEYARVQVGPREGYMLSASLFKTDRLTSLVKLYAARQRTKDEGPPGPVVLYEYPLLEGKTVSVPDFTTLTVLDTVGSWYYVAMGEQRGYVPVHYLVAARNDMEFDDKMYSVVTNPNPKDRLNLRAKPSKSSDSLGKYFNGTQVEVLDYDVSGWAHVLVDGKEGYMLVEYIFAILDYVEDAYTFGNG